MSRTRRTSRDYRARYHETAADGRRMCRNYAGDIMRTMFKVSHPNRPSTGRSQTLANAFFFPVHFSSAFTCKGSTFLTCPGRETRTPVNNSRIPRYLRHFYHVAASAYVPKSYSSVFYSRSRFPIRFSFFTRHRVIPLSRMPMSLASSSPAPLYYHYPLLRCALRRRCANDDELFLINTHSSYLMRNGL